LETGVSDHPSAKDALGYRTATVLEGESGIEVFVKKPVESVVPSKRQCQGDVGHFLTEGFAGNPELVPTKSSETSHEGLCGFPAQAFGYNTSCRTDAGGL
jgi:hypothetical protein